MGYEAFPEPGTLGLVAVFGGGVLFIRRKLMIWNTSQEEAIEFGWKVFLSGCFSHDPLAYPRVE